jgi:deoxyribodipyrimidine photo-lyase
MIGARRPTWNFALDRARHWARELRQPLVVFEALRADYRWASDRLHQLALDGMRDNAAAFDRAGITYYPYVEPAPRAGRGLLRALSEQASVVVTDDTPVFDLPRLVERAAPQIAVRFEAVDGNGILPLAAPPASVVFPTAYAFRRYLQRELPRYLDDAPAATLRPMAAAPARIPGRVLARWPPGDIRARDATVALATLPIDHRVAPVGEAGGASAAGRRLRRFISHQLERYAEHRNDLEDEACSRLSGCLHFGHLSAHEVVHRVLAHDGWSPRQISRQARGAREGWWGASPPVEAFLDQLITWRELGFLTAARLPDYQSFDSLPPWAIRTLDAHAADARAHLYAVEQLDEAATHDPLWNAAQTQLRREGRIHNYLRMLWGKKILEWTASPRDALEAMIELNNRYAVDGRDPNSYSGIMWVLGRYDRPWPERTIFGTVRYMSSENTARKMRMRGYLARFGASPAR